MIRSIIKQEGSKYMYLNELFSLFPHHTTYVEPFMGSGVVAINHNAKYKLLNDHNKLVYYTYMILKTKRGPEKLAKEIAKLPVYKEILKTKSNSLVEWIAKDLVLSANKYIGKSGPLRNGPSEKKESLYEAIKNRIFYNLENTVFSCMDFRKFLNSITAREKREEHTFFIYCDPPYVFEEGGHHTNKGFKESDLVDLLNCLKKREWKYAISCRNKSAEFFADHGLQIEELCKVKSNLRRDHESEFLAMNYKKELSLF